MHITCVKGEWAIFLELTTTNGPDVDQWIDGLTKPFINNIWSDWLLKAEEKYVQITSQQFWVLRATTQIAEKFGKPFNQINEKWPLVVKQCIRCGAIFYVRDWQAISCITKIGQRKVDWVWPTPYPHSLDISVII